MSTKNEPQYKVKGVVDLGEFEVNYDQTIVEKLAALDRRRVFGSHRFITDEVFPDDRKGQKTWKASVVMFDQDIIAEVYLQEWASKNNKILARLKEGIDIVRSLLHPGVALMGAVPFVMAGQINANRAATYDLAPTFVGGHARISFHIIITK